MSSSSSIYHPKNIPDAPHGKVKLTLEYDGTRYFGWQRQSPDKPSIQSTIEDALKAMFGVAVHLMGAGRTDAGVHAMAQVAHFIAPKEVRGYNFSAIFANSLPPDISVMKAELMPAYFHAQKSAIGKIYCYKIWNNPRPSALRANRSLWIRKPLDLDRMNRGAELLVGTRDFNCFRSEGSAVKSTIRTVYSAKFLKSDDYVEFYIHGDGFLKQMVRNIMGTLLQIEMGLRDLESLPGLMESGDRTQAGPTVAPQGLYLKEVFYPGELDKQAQPL